MLILAFYWEVYTKCCKNKESFLKTKKLIFKEDALDTFELVDNLSENMIYSRNQFSSRYTKFPIIKKKTYFQISNKGTSLSEKLKSLTR